MLNYHMLVQETLLPRVLHSQRTEGACVKSIAVQCSSHFLSYYNRVQPKDHTGDGFTGPARANH